MGEFLMFSPSAWMLHFYMVRSMDLFKRPKEVGRVLSWVGVRELGYARVEKSPTI
ncbi:MAG: hypothetical protein ABIN18_20260 [Pseudomonadota bacterium]